VLTLQVKGIDARVLEGGLRGYEATGRPLSTGPNP
jgi:3-mercaptopyruvate sulfurtransferase SseA